MTKRITIRLVPEGQVCRILDLIDGETRELVYKRGDDTSLPWGKFPWLKKESWCAAKLVSLRQTRLDGTVRRYVTATDSTGAWFTFGLTPVILDEEGI